MEPFVSFESDLEQPVFQVRGKNTAKPADNNQDRTRSKFIRLLHVIQLFRLLLVLVVSIIFYKKVENSLKYVQEHPQLAMIAIMIGVFLIFSIICISDLMFAFPFNVICALALTAEEVLLAVILISYIRHLEILVMIGLFVAITFVLLLLSLQPIFIPTVIIKMIFVVTVVIIGTVAIFIVRKKSRIPLKIITCSVMPFLFGSFTVYDTNLMLTGQHTFEYANKDYMQGSFDLLLDLFRYMLFAIVHAIELILSKIIK